MEDHRERLAVIVAGYTEPMRGFLSTNTGLASRFTRFIEFDDYYPEELVAIFETMCADSHYELTTEARMAVRAAIRQRHASRDATFGNARSMRQLFQATVERQANRLSKDASASWQLLLEEDIAP